MNKLRGSGFLNDLYRDLRDRRLLIPIAALLVAMVAVPTVLTSSAEQAPPPAVPPIGDEAAQVEPAVLTAAPGIRNYRKRLDALNSKDPFEQKFALPTPESVALQERPVAATGSTGETPAPETGDTGSGTPTPVDEITVDDTESVEVDDTAPQQGGDGSKPPKPEVRFFAGRVDVAIGPVGAVKKHTDVRYLDFLPSDRAPVVAFLGLGEGAEKAVFSVSSDVTETDGEGSCAPKPPASCQFVTLRVGEQQTFRYNDGSVYGSGEPYRLKLLDTDVVRVPDPRDAVGGG